MVAAGAAHGAWGHAEGASAAGSGRADGGSDGGAAAAAARAGKLHAARAVRSAVTGAGLLARGPTHPVAAGGADCAGDRHLRESVAGEAGGGGDGDGAGDPPAPDGPEAWGWGAAGSTDGAGGGLGPFYSFGVGGGSWLMRRTTSGPRRAATAASAFCTRCSLAASSAGPVSHRLSCAGTSRPLTPNPSRRTG